MYGKLVPHRALRAVLDADLSEEKLGRARLQADENFENVTRARRLKGESRRT